MEGCGFGVELFGCLGPLGLRVVMRVDVVMFWSRQISKSGRSVSICIQSSSRSCTYLMIINIMCMTQPASSSTHLRGAVLRQYEKYLRFLISFHASQPVNQSISSWDAYSKSFWRCTNVRCYIGILVGDISATLICELWWGLSLGPRTAAEMLSLWNRGRINSVSTTSCYHA